VDFKRPKRNERTRVSKVVKLKERKGGSEGSCEERTVWFGGVPIWNLAKRFGNQQRSKEMITTAALDVIWMCQPRRNTGVRSSRVRWGDRGGNSS
jgi:hypothetical protein